MKFINNLRCLALALFIGGMACVESYADELIFGVTDNQFLVTWDSSAPNNLLSGVAISGLQQNEQILGIDIRPLDNQIYAVGSSNRLYTLGTNGVATQVGPVFSIPLNGSSFGYDFNPTIDRSRIDTNTNRNYVVNPNDGLITQATDVFYPNGDPNFGVDPNVVHLAYTNNFAGAVTSQLFGIDTGLDILVTQANSAGTLGTVGSLGVDITELGGFDISGATGIAYGAFQTTVGNNSQFFSIDLSTGQVTLIGQIAGGTRITAITVQAQVIPEPASSLVIVGLAAAAVFRRRR